MADKSHPYHGIDADKLQFLPQYEKAGVITVRSSHGPDRVITKAKIRALVKAGYRLNQVHAFFTSESIEAAMSKGSANAGQNKAVAKASDSKATDSKKSKKSSDNGID